MSKLLIYPYTEEHEYFLKHSSMIVDFELTSIVTDKGYSANSKIIRWANLPKHFVISTSLYDDACKCDGILYLSKAEDNECINTLPNIDKKKFLKFERKKIDNNTLNDITKDKKMRLMNIPIITVYGQGENTQKFDIQLDLRARLIEDGYRVLSFGTKDYSGIFGMEVLPDYSNLPLWKKVLFINEYVYSFARKDNPDVIILGVPGGIMPANKVDFQYFGEDSLALTMAIEPDITILSVYENLASYETISETEKFFKYRLGAKLDIVHVSNTRYMPQENKNPIYLRVKESHVFNRINKLSRTHKSFICSDCEKSKAVYSRIIEKLSSNVPVV